ncbi:Ig-like domain-containing protein [Stigmatella sp. ncwal1]|uniref:Ig-like domain-containing protein n=1 Tax=Stigmatella ashevillensis TaxID=2995309 RepID=A0ABT5DNI0_9BACT|nr:Ig-like domain-containing protein [Stigmatella ashevillena]MDC0715148.1 Ig-like domain-containing protein [Stigmatella ashevillena]
MRLGLASCVALASVFWVACEPPPPATLEFVDQSPAQPRLGEITTVRFRAVDSRGLPQAGSTVSFRLQPEVPGVSLSPTEASTNVGDGIASTQIIATGRVASAVVVATSGDKTAVSPAVSFAGANAHSKQFTFQCGEVAGNASGGVHAIGAYDETRYLIAGVKLRCTAHVADRNGDGIAGAQVSFITEAGTIGPSSTSITDVVGNAQVLYKTSYPLPVETDPGTFTWSPINDATHTGDYLAPLWMQPFIWTENPIRDYGTAINPQTPRPEPFRKDPLRPNRINNPRDNLVAMIAVTTGEEGYDDANNNGQFDAGETFVDLTEPFVDNNDNGTWDAGERFVDTNANGRWDGKNGQFDASTLIWVQERILWTGWPHPMDRDLTPLNEVPVVRQLSPPAGTTVNVGHFAEVFSTFLLADPWFNGLARNSNEDGCKGGAVGPVVVDPLPKGVAYTYPAFTVEIYKIRDAHDIQADPPPAPFPAPGIAFDVNASCSYTGSPEEGHVVLVPAPPLKGLVQ